MFRTIEKIIKNFNPLVILLLLLITSVSIVYLLRVNLNNSFALGKHTFLIFIPFFLYAIYELIFNYKSFNLIIFLIFILISFVPIFQYLNNIIIHQRGDDSWVFLSSSRYMLENLTLTFSEKGLIYQHHPGISYFYAAELLIFGDEKRLLQIFNIIIFFTVFFYFKEKLINYLDDVESFIFRILLLLTVPYIIKNILYTYSEWLTVLLICVLPLCYLNKNRVLFVIFLALIPFVRQNLLIATLIFFIFIEYQEFKVSRKLNYKTIIIFFIVLCLPIFHNIYYAHTFALLNQNIPIIFVNAESISDYFSLKWLINNYMQLINVIFFRIKEIFLISHFSHTKVLFINIIGNKIISIFVLPMIFYLFYKIYSMKQINKKIIMIIIFLTTFVPTVILGNQSFPRFEFVTIFFCLSSFFYINTDKNRTKS